jgi:DNA ligase 1
VNINVRRRVLTLSDDGERAQVHLEENGTISIFSRNLENNSSKYPDITGIIQQSKLNHVKSFILDCEVVGMKNGKILPFQTCKILFLSHLK